MARLNLLEETRFEKLPVSVFWKTPRPLQSVWPNVSGNLIKEKQQNNTYAVLGLATGATPMELLLEPVRMHQRRRSQFQRT